MLNPSVARLPRRPPSTRPRTLVVALAPTARVAHLGAAGITATLSAIPPAVAVAKGGSGTSPALVVSFLVAGATLGWAVEDPAGQLLAAMPVASPARTAMRAVMVAVVAMAGAAAGVGFVVIGPGFPADLGDRLPEAAASGAIALAVGLVAVRRGERGAGPGGVTAGVLGSGLIAALAFRWPAVLPSFAAGAAHARWWLVTAFALAVVTRAGRDPGRPVAWRRTCAPATCPDPRPSRSGPRPPSAPGC